MKILDLKTAARQIQASCVSKRERNEHPPFFFIVGAGLSTPSIPLSAEIVQHCKDRAEKIYGMADPPPAKDPLTTYSYWLEHAYPNAEDRRGYLQNLIEGKAITPANLRLAHLLLNKSPSNIVVTTNFDDLLSRALLLFGKQHVLCDHPSTIGRIQPEREREIQIVHVHGSYWFYDCCNLKDEIAARAQRSPNLSFDMSAFLDHLLHNRSPLVFGYSGWEDDVVMSALHRRLYHNEQPNVLGYNIYWFLYDRAHIAALPKWLQEHPNVVFTAKSKPEPESEPFMKNDAEQMPALPAMAANSIGLEEDKRDVILTAHEAFDELIRVFDLPAPELTQNPLNFFITGLRQSLPPDQPGNVQPDIYLMRSMLERLVWAQQKLAETQQHMETQLESVRDALRRAQYREALQLGVKIPLENLFEEQRREIMNLMWEAADALRDNSGDELCGYERIEAASALLPALAEEAQVLLARALLRKGYVLGQLNRNEDAIAVYEEMVHRFGEATELLLREQVAKALVNKGNEFGRLNRNEDAIAVYEEIVRRFGEATGLPLREQVAKALVNKGNEFGRLNRDEDALAVYEETVRRFGEATELPLLERVAMALVNKGITLSSLNRYEETLAVYDEIVRRFSMATELSLRERVAKALMNKGYRLSKLNRNEDALAVYEEVQHCFSEATELPLREQVAMALLNKGITLGTLNRSEEALTVYDEMMRRVGEATELPLREQVARALLNKGITLGTLNRSEEALAVYDEMARRFGEATELPLREQVARALVNKGITLGTLNRDEDAIAVYEEVVRRLGEATELPLRERVAIALVNKGVTLGRLTRSEDAIAVYEEVLRRFGEATELPLREQVAKALVNKGITLGTLDRNEDAIAVYEEVVRRFGEAIELPLRELVAIALRNKGNRLRTLNRDEDAIAVYGEVVRRFGEATELSLREQVAIALVNKGNRLGTLNRDEDAIAVYEEVVRRFGEATELSLRERAASALNSIGFKILCEAKETWGNGEIEKAKQHLLLAREKIIASLERRPQEPVTLGNYGYIQFLLGEKEHARELLTQAISFGGEKIRQGELDDANIHPLPQDEEFSALVRAISVEPKKEPSSA